MLDAIFTRARAYAGLETRGPDESKPDAGKAQPPGDADP
jgi:hypothetical protein